MTRPPLRVPEWARFWRRVPQRRLVAAAGALLLLVALALAFGGGQRETWPRRTILDAIRFVESSDRDDVPDGDGGLAIGPYQIHRVYWQDAAAFDASLGGDYQDCRRRDYAERVIDAYMRRWVPGAWRTGDAEVIARVHNGGPRGDLVAATRRYWERVRARLP
ncbi:MAG: hypothetical protein JNL08_18055 [Planctomycetes bacterium]|nr:hypothetical protein [Planctomycetota bacterium]